MRKILFTLLSSVVSLALATPGITDALLVTPQGQPDPCIYFDSPSSTFYCYADNGRLASSKQLASGWQVETNYTVKTSTGEAWKSGIGAPSVGYLVSESLHGYEQCT